MDAGPTSRSSTDPQGGIPKGFAIYWASLTELLLLLLLWTKSISVRGLLSAILDQFLAARGEAGRYLETRRRTWEDVKPLLGQTEQTRCRFAPAHPSNLPNRPRGISDHPQCGTGVCNALGGRRKEHWGSHGVRAVSPSPPRGCRWDGALPKGGSFTGETRAAQIAPWGMTRGTDPISP